MAKSKCDQGWPSCRRCTSRSIVCNYRKSLPNVTRSNGNGVVRSESVDDTVPMAETLHFEPRLPRNTIDDGVSANYCPSPPSSNAVSTPNDWSFNSIMAHFADGSDNGSNSIDGETPALSPDAWLQTVVPRRTPLDPLRQYSLEFCLRILKTWPHMMSSKYRIPPIFHNTQLIEDSMEEPLAHCYSIVNMWHSQREKSKALVHKIIVQEMTGLFHNECIPPYNT
jgi:hypothetical protein